MSMRDITGSADVNIWGSCSGGITMSAFLAHLAARGERKVHSATVAVCVLDMAVAQNTTAGMFVTPESIVAAQERLAARRRGRRPGARPHVRLDAAQRPDLELLGEQLPARQRAARLRRALLEQRHHAAAGAAACRLPRSHRHQSLRQCRPARGARHAARHAPGEHGQLRGRRRDRSHHAVARLLQHGEALWRAQHLRARPTAAISRACSIRPAIPRPCSGPARPARRTREAWLAAGDQAERKLVAALARVDQGALGRDRRRRRPRSAAPRTRRSTQRPAAT